MALPAGTRLGPYEIRAALGAGGMGEVYEATDARLDRTVAIKVLPDHVASDPELRQRFEREAKTLAALNHPHICHIHDIGSQDGIDFLVMEYLKGETLEQRLTRGALPVDQALRTAMEIADALDAAHRTGIVHRDLKPGNVMLTKAGTKLLDFGLAKRHPEAAVSVAAMTGTPTVSSPLTGMGRILGTFQYMAPEQLEGKEADARTDIFAFGAVVYEMVTGKKAFEGKSHASLIAAIISSEPRPIGDIQPLSPPALGRTLARCLAKDPDDRWQSARDLLEALRWAAEPVSPAVRETPQRQRHSLAWRLTVAGIASATALGGLGVLATDLLRSADPPSPMRLTIPISSEAFEPRISPDGRQLAYVSTGGRLFIRPLDSTTERPLTGVFATDAEWSPDGQSLAFSGQGRLARVNVQSEQVLVLCDLPPTTEPAGITWNDEGAIVFSAAGILYVVPAGGGTPTQVTTLNQARGDVAHLWPQFLPDNQRFIFLVQAREPENTGIYAGSLDSQDTTLVLRTEVRARLTSDYLLFVRQGALLAQPFDTRTMRLEGEPTQIANEVGTFVGYGAAWFSASDTGLLVYRPDHFLSARRELRWFDRNGTTLGSIGEPAPGFIVNLSPDETRVATTRYTNGNAGTWITDLNRSVASPLEADRTGEFDPQWSPDGTRIAFSSDRKGPMALFQRPVAGGTTELLYASDSAVFMSDWSSDGQYVLYHQGRTKFGALPMSGERTPMVVLDTPFGKDQAQFSPDTRWIAYNADNSGRFEVYVTSFPRGGEEMRVSRDGGVQPRWRADGRELFFLDLESRLMSVDVRDTSGRLEFGVPRLLFQAPVEATPEVELYDVTRDGRRFLMMVPLESSASQINVIVNWSSTLAR
jgi:serine/threonine protein kinase